jgi:nucleotide-binding universal stress UspA family protein
MSNVASHMGVVVGVDDSPASRVAVQWAARDAELSDMPLTLVHAISPEIGGWMQVGFPPGLAQWQKTQGHRIIDAALRTVDQACKHNGPARVDTELICEAAVPALLDLSKEAKLIAVGSHGIGGLGDRVLGSVSSALVHHARCPVAVVHDDDPRTPASSHAPVLVGIDGSPASELATAIAFDEASHRNVGLLALHAWSDKTLLRFPDIDWPAIKTMQHKELVEHLAGWRERYPRVNVQVVIVPDEPARRLLEHSAAAQLTVVGSHGRSAFVGMSLGSVSAAVAHSARTPVIVARQPEA